MISLSRKKICLVFGTRPEIIKLSPIIRFCQSKNADYFMIHTGQHYSYDMDRVFFSELALPKPKYRLKSQKASRSQAGAMIGQLVSILSKEAPDVVFVQGDTNSVLAGAIAASMLRIPVAHVEAGLRSFDRTMPEEVNRIIADHLSSYLFAPTQAAKQNATREGISASKIYITGNTIVDSVDQNIALSKKSNILKELGLQKQKYILATAHRQENADSRERLFGIIRGLELVSEKLGVPVIYPIHPRTRKMARKFGIKTKNITMIKPLGFLDFLQLESNAKLIMTDSGGMQEEACILGVPCVTLRDNTERPETIDAGCNMLSGTDPKSILSSAEQMVAKKSIKKNPFGDGKATERIMKVVMR